MYKIYLGEMLFPIAPPKITFKYNGNNKTITLIDGGERNIIKSPKLSDISFEVLLPKRKYPFAFYEKQVPKDYYGEIKDNGYLEPQYYIEKLEKMNRSKLPVYFKIIRQISQNKYCADNNCLLPVTLESYSLKEDAKEGLDIKVSIDLKEFRIYGTSKYLDNGDGTVSKHKLQQQIMDSLGGTVAIHSYTIKKEERYWDIWKRFCSDTMEFYEFMELNEISNPDITQEGKVLNLGELPGYSIP